MPSSGSQIWTRSKNGLSLTPLPFLHSLYDSPLPRWIVLPYVTNRHPILSQAFAYQAAAFVIDVGAMLDPEQVPEHYREQAESYPGESHIIGPKGEILAGPAEGETILTADVSSEQIFSAKAICDDFLVFRNSLPARDRSEDVEDRGCSGSSIL